MFNGLAIFADHPGFFQAPEVKHLIGVTHSATFNEETQAADAVFRFYTSDEEQADGRLADILVDTLDVIISDRQEGIPAPDLGISLTFWPLWEPGDDRPRILRAFKKIDSADLVFSPAADGRILEALSARAHTVGGNDMPAPLEDVVTPADPEDGAEQPPAELATQAPLPLDPAEAEPSGPSVWLEAARRAATPGILAASGLPQVSQERLGTISWETPEALQAAIEAERAYLATLTENQVIQMDGPHPRGAGAGDSMSTSLDRIESAVEAMISGTAPPSGVRPLTGIRELYMLLSGDYEMTGLFQPDRVLLANVNSSTMAGLVANALNKVVVNQFALYPQWWTPFTNPVDFPNLQDARWITLGGVGELPTVAEGASYTELTWDDQTETDAFVKKGGYLGLTLEAIDKDDTGRIMAAPRALAQGAWLTLAKAVSAIFTTASGTGPTMSDSVVLFHAATHSNLGTTALSFAAWEATRIAMRKQTELHSGERLGALVAPKFCLVPPDLETTALQVLASALEPQTANNDTNPFAEGEGRAALLASARSRVIVIDLWTDTNNWAAVADPMLYPSIGIGYRYGRQPEIFSVASPTAGLMFSNDTMPIKVRFFFAVGPTDWRGLYKHNVA
jgi:hypothetical protein